MKTFKTIKIMKITFEQEIILQKAVEKWGNEMQIDVCIEELSELIQALCKYKRNKPHALSNVKEEMADVFIMLRQMKMIFDIYPDETIQQHIDFKVNRLKERIES